MIISLCFTFEQQFGTICCPSKNDICLIFSENKYSLILLFQEFIELRTKTNLSQINSKSSFRAIDHMPRIKDDMMVLDPGTPSTPAKYGADI